MGGKESCLLTPERGDDEYLALQAFLALFFLAVRAFLVSFLGAIEPPMTAIYALPAEEKRCQTFSFTVFKRSHPLMIPGFGGKVT